MYDWLDEATAGEGTVVTANRRLARLLRRRHALVQCEAGRSAWTTPRILAWQDWMTALLADTTREQLPTLINAHQSHWLWEQCLRRELGNEERAGVAALVRLARDAWQRLADWQLGIRDVARAASGIDQQLFASVAGRYQAMLEQRDWIDDAGLAWLVPELLESGEIAIDGAVTFAGFDREKPVRRRLANAIHEAGCKCHEISTPAPTATVGLCRSETAESELRAAGAWARGRLQENPALRVGIVATDLERDAGQAARLVREGLVPGWQYGAGQLRATLDVSYGRRLVDYPAVSQAIVLLGWLQRDLRADEIAHLLRSPLVAGTVSDARSALEKRLRQLPDRDWSPSMLAAALSTRARGGDAADWLARVRELTTLRRALPQTLSPSEWAQRFDGYLAGWMWPGPGTLDSADFQLVNRWRELLNDFARLELVSPRISLEAALARIEIMATDTVFQPEGAGGAVALLGPLEAFGAEFDALWITGVSAANWPPAASPSPLLSRRLQREAGMPDAEPADTVAYATRLLSGLCSAAPEVVCSFAEIVDDAEQVVTPLLAPVAASTPLDAPVDPGMHATTLVAVASLSLAEDAVPAMQFGEKLAGGAYTLQCQLNDPATAFIRGRLGAAPLDAQARGLPASLRGSLIHVALHRLYGELPTRDGLAAWPQEERERRIDAAVDLAVHGEERHADSALLQLLGVERARIRSLLGEFLAVDIARDAFRVDAVEQEIEFSRGPVQLRLRVDRIDRFDDGSVVILDYKTGARKRFFEKGQPRDIQLVAYSCALSDAVAGLALVNVDPRHVDFDGAGPMFKAVDDWAATLEEWQKRVHEACGMLAQGDVRINIVRGIKDARPFNLLTRYTELRRDN